MLKAQRFMSHQVPKVYEVHTGAAEDLEAQCTLEA